MGRHGVRRTDQILSDNELGAGLVRRQGRVHEAAWTGRGDKPPVGLTLRAWSVMDTDTLLASLSGVVGTG